MWSYASPESLWASLKTSRADGFGDFIDSSFPGVEVGVEITTTGLFGVGGGFVFVSSIMFFSGFHVRGSDPAIFFFYFWVPFWGVRSARSQGRLSAIQRGTFTPGYGYLVWGEEREVPYMVRLGCVRFHFFTTNDPVPFYPMVLLLFCLESGLMGAGVGSL